MRNDAIWDAGIDGLDFVFMGEIVLNTFHFVQMN